MKVRAHTCYIGRSGYAAHARGFFRELSKHVDLRVRNYTWDENPSYLREEDFKILEKITLSGGDGQKDWPIKEASQFFEHWKNMPFVDHEEDWAPDVDIVLMEQDHFYFYHEYKAKIKIAYMVWESSEVTQSFFERILNHFDYFMVVSEWHKEMIIRQGYPEDRILVVPEGVDEEFYPMINPTTHQIKQKFQFLFFGRWDYRKAVPEILKAVLEEFKNDDFELILSADNPYSIDGMNSTEERLEKYGLLDERIKVQHFLDRKSYLAYMKTGDVLITCARSEGWNIPLIEGLASGIPVTYSNWGAQLEFCEGRGNPVKIKEELPASLGAELGFAGNVPGSYCEPDFEDLKTVLRSIYNDWESYRDKALKDSEEIRRDYNWKRIGEIGYEKMKGLEKKLAPNPTFKVSFLDGPKLEILDSVKSKYKVSFIDRESSETKFTCVLENNQWAACGIKYFVLWKITVQDFHSEEVLYEYDFDPTGRKIYITLESSSLGDSIAWIPPVEEFRKKWNCKVELSTFRNSLFETEYPEIKFKERHETVEDPYAIYRIGWFYASSGDEIDSGRNKENFRKIPMQKASSDILGLEYKEVRTKIAIPERDSDISGDYVCIGIHGTAQAKYWNREGGWQKLCNWLRSIGYKVVLISQEHSGYMGNPHPYGIVDKSGNYPLEDRIVDLKGAKAFIGIGSGLSWLAWAVGTPVVMISGFSEPYSEFECIRVINKNVCHGCFNRHRLNAGDWNWCPDQKGTDRQFECTKSIHPIDVIRALHDSKVIEIKKNGNEILYEGNLYEFNYFRKNSQGYLHIKRKSGEEEKFFYISTDFGKRLISVKNSSVVEVENSEWIDIMNMGEISLARMKVVKIEETNTVPEHDQFFSFRGRRKILIEKIEGNKLHYYISSKDTREVRITVEENGKNVYDHTMEMIPKASYWTQIPGGLKNPTVTFIDSSSNRVLEKITLG